MPNKYRFLREDYLILEKRVKALRKQVAKLGEENREEYKDANGDPADKVSFFQVSAEFGVRSTQLDDLADIMEHAEVIDLDQLPKDGRVRIGRTVTVLNMGTGEQRTFRVGSFMVFQKVGEHEIPIYAYNSPRAKAFLGAEKGEEVQFTHEKKTHTYKILKIK